MTRPHDDEGPPRGGGALRGDPERAEQIRAELAALGEEPADDDELELALAAHEAADVRTVATLVELSTWVPPAEELSALERHRVWQRVARRVAPAAAGGHGAPAANGATGMRGVVASLALVASVALLLRVDVAPPPSAEDKAALESAGQAAREVLELTVPGLQDGARAQSLAEGYAARLHARGAVR